MLIYNRMSSISSITKSSCFDAIQKTISWLPDIEDDVLPEKIRTIVLEKLLACQEEFIVVKDEIHSEQIKKNDFRGSLDLLKKLKLFNDRSKIMELFLSSPFGKKLIPKHNLIRQAIRDRLKINYKEIDAKLSPTLENLTPYLKQCSPLSLDFFEKMFENRYECPSFASHYLDFLYKESPLQIKDWLKNEPAQFQRIATFPCYLLPKLFAGFQKNLNNLSYPKGFFTENRRLIDYFHAFNQIENRDIRKHIQQLECQLQTHLTYLTKVHTTIEIETLKKIASFSRKNPVHRKQLRRFLEKQDLESIGIDFPLFTDFIKQFPNVKSGKWKALLSLYRKDAFLLSRLIGQKCLRNKTRRQDKLICVGSPDTSYLKNIVDLLDWCREQKIMVFYRLVKHYSRKQITELKPLITLAQDDGLRSTIVKGLQWFLDKPVEMYPLLKLPKEQWNFILVLLGQMKMCSKKEIEKIFSEHSLNKLYMQLYQPDAVNPFMLRFLELSKSDPHLRKPFEEWLRVNLDFVQNRKDKNFELKSRSIPLRALEMPPEHLTPFFRYASKHFHYKHLSHLLYLERNCRKHFTTALDFVERHPDLLIHLTTICNRLGSSTAVRLLKMWSTHPAITLALLTHNRLSAHFFEGFFEFLKIDSKRIENYLFLNEHIPDLFLRLDQDIHLISTSFLGKLCSDKITRDHFCITIKRVLPHMISKLIRLLCENYQNHPEDSLRALNVAKHNPSTLLYLLKLIQQEDVEGKEFLNFLENCQPHISLHLATLLESYENQEFVRVIQQIINKHDNVNFARRLLDMSLEGYYNESLELGNRYICCQFTDLNKLLFSLAGSHNAHLISFILDWNDRQKFYVQPLLISSKKEDVLVTLRMISEERYALVDFMKKYKNNPISKTSQENHIANEISRGNLYYAEWLLKNEIPKTVQLKNMLSPLLEGIQNGSGYAHDKKCEALEVGLAAGIALSIMSSDGMIHRSLIPQVKETILKQTHIPCQSDTVEYVLNVLNIIENNCDDICVKFLKYQQPPGAIPPQSNTIISYFFEDPELDDFRFCVLSALLMRPRQKQLVGNCFASQMSVQTSSCSRGLSLACDDYFEILSTDGLKRIDPIHKRVISYQLTKVEPCEPGQYPTDHPLVRARETLLANMGSGVYSLKLHRENFDLFLPKARHNYLYRLFENNRSHLQLSSATTTLLQNSFKSLSDVHYDPYVIDPLTNSNGAWRLSHKIKQRQIISYEDYHAFLLDVISNVKSKANLEQTEALDHLHNYLTTSSHFKNKIYSYYKRKKGSPHNTHWLDFSGGMSEGVRIRYFGYDGNSIKISCNVRYAKDALREIFSFYDLLSERMREKVNSDEHYRIPVDYSYHCANLVLYEIKDLSLEKLLNEMDQDVKIIRNLVFNRKGYENMIELFRGKLPEFLGASWAHLMYRDHLDEMNLGRFCDASRKALSVLCVSEDKVGDYVRLWENCLRYVNRVTPRVWTVIDTNWKDHQNPFFNVYLGIGGSIFYQQPIFFCGTRGNYHVQKLNFSQGLWEFNFPIDL